MPYLFFSTSSEHNNVACPTTASVQELSSSSAQLTPRKKAKRRQKRKGKKKLEKKEKQQHRHRMPSGVPEQESGCSLVQILVRILVILCTSFTLNMLVKSWLLVAFSLIMYKAKLPQSLAVRGLISRCSHANISFPVLWKSFTKIRQNFFLWP